MATTLTDNNISDTYTGLIHAQGAQLPAAGQVILYDGNGNATSVRLGRSGNGATITGILSAQQFKASGINYPTVDGNENEALITDGNGNAFFGSLSGSLPDLTPSPANTYTSLSSLTVDAKGRVTDVGTGAGGSLGLANQYRYVTPITLFEITNDYSADVNVNQANKPDDATYAIIQIEMELERNQKVGYVQTFYVDIKLNNVLVDYQGNKRFSGSHTDQHARIIERYAKIDGSGNVNFNFTTVGSNTNYYAKATLVGYANFTQLTNP